MGEVAVIVVSWNTRAELLECAASVLASEGVDLELVVVDNGSSDGSAAGLRAAHPHARVLEMGANLGFAEGVNRGLAASGAPWVLLLNSDAALAPGALRLLLDAARAAPDDVAALQPALLFKDAPHKLNSTGIELYTDGTACDRDFGALDAGRAAGEIFGTTAGAALYRRSALERVALPSGVLDRGFFMYLEDVDLAWRLRLAGYRARYVAGARVLHRYQASSRHQPPRFVGRKCRENRLRMLAKNASPSMWSRGLYRTVRDLWAIAADDGAAELLRVLAGCARGLRERRLVTRLARVPRRDLERRWVTAIPWRTRLAAAARRRLARLAEAR